MHNYDLKKNNLSKTALYAVLLFFVLCLGLRYLTLGTAALSDPSESRYALIGKEMVLSGNWITQQTYINGERTPFLGKPPLHAWLTGASLKFFGISEVSARLPSFIAACGTLFFVAFFCLNFFSFEVMILSVFFLLSSALFFLMSGACLTDPVLSVLVAGVMLSFALAANQPETKKGQFFGYAFFLCLGLGMLSKGPVVGLLTGLPIFLWLLIHKKFLVLKNLPWKFGLLIFFITWVPVYLLIERENPGFLRYFLINENFLRYLVRSYGDRYGSGHVYPYGTIWLMMFAAFCPWTLLLIFLLNIKFIREKGREIFSSPWVSYAILWGLSPAIIFTFARQISIPYVLPGLAGLAILSAVIVVEAINSGLESKVHGLFRNNLVCAGVISLVIVLAGIFLENTNQYRLFAVVVFLGLLLLIRLHFRQASISIFPLIIISTGSTIFTFVLIFFSISVLLNSKISTKALIEHFKNTPELASAELVFADKIPLSAYFYTGFSSGADSIDSFEPFAKNKVIAIPSTELNTDNPPIFIAKDKYAKRFTNEQLKIQKKIGTWVLFSKS